MAFSNQSYSLTFASVPFVSDKSADIPYFADVGIERKVQPQFDLMEELNRLLPPEYLKDFALPDNYPGKNLSALAHPSDLGPKPDSKIRVGDWYYPTGVRRWSVFRGLATSSQVKAMLTACRYQFSSFDEGFYSGAFAGYQSGSVPFSGSMNSPQNIPTTGTGTVPAPFVMKCLPTGAKMGVGSHEIRSYMYMLPPRPLGELAGTFDGLYLVTLVDERFHMQTTPALLELQKGMTWEFLLNELAITLGIELSTFSEIEEVYGSPELDSQFWALEESAAALLDAVALNVGRSVVRNYDGSYTLYTPLESQQLVNANRGIVNSSFPVSGHLTPQPTIRTAGGDMFVSGMRLPVGNLTNAKNWVIPNNIVVSFPKFIVGNDPVPHFVDRRTQSQRSRWYEDSYGGVYSVVVPIQSGGINVSGLVGQSDSYLHDTAKALLSGEVAINSGTPLNNSGLVALSVQLAQDYYNNQVGAGIDEVYPGIVNWIPEGLCDVLFTYSETAGGAFTRAMRKSWTNEVDEFQHSTPNYSGFTGGPGVGGKSVAQAWRDSFGQSGSFVGLSGTVQNINGVNTLSGTWVQSGSICTRLNQTLVSGGLTAGFTRIDHFPTQNRWWGKIVASGLPDETILFEGTSGGVAGDYSGNLVGIVQRGVMGTIQREHNNGSFLSQTTPDAGYNVNLVTHEKGQFVYPSEWTSGGVQGINVVPQTQTVRVLDTTGTTISGVRHFSGRVAVYDSTRVISGGPWVPTDLVWVVDRTSGTIPTLSGLYDGQFVGYSASQSGMVAAPVYAIGVVNPYSLSTRSISPADESILTTLTQPLFSGVDKVVINNVNFLPPSNRYWVKLFNSGSSDFSGIVRLLVEGTSGGISSGGFLSGYVYNSGGGSATLATTAPAGFGFFQKVVFREDIGSPLLISGGIAGGTRYSIAFNPTLDECSGVNMLSFMAGPGNERGLGKGGRLGNATFPGGWLSGFRETVIQPQFRMVAVTSIDGIFWSGSVKYPAVTIEPNTDQNGNNLLTGDSQSESVFVQNINDSLLSGLPPVQSGNYIIPTIKQGRAYFGMLVGYSAYISGGTPGYSGDGPIRGTPVYAIDQPIDDPQVVQLDSTVTIAEGPFTYRKGRFQKWVESTGIMQNYSGSNPDIYVRSPLGESLTANRSYLARFVGTKIFSVLSGGTGGLSWIYIADRHTTPVIIDALTLPDVEFIQILTTASGTPGLFATPSSNNQSGSPRAVTIGYHA